MTILLIEHVMRAVMSLSRRVVVLSQGQVLAAGSPDAIARDPQVVEAYLGEAYGDAGEGERAGA
jgi:ABC-type branched-subunit amino acid transport system ATPase component